MLAASLAAWASKRAVSRSSDRFSDSSALNFSRACARSWRASRSEISSWACRSSMAKSSSCRAFSRAFLASSAAASAALRLFSTASAELNSAFARSSSRPEASSLASSSLTAFSSLIRSMIRPTRASFPAFRARSSCSWRAIRPSAASLAVLPDFFSSSAVLPIRPGRSFWALIRRSSTSRRAFADSVFSFSIFWR